MKRRLRTEWIASGVVALCLLLGVVMLMRAATRPALAPRTSQLPQMLPKEIPGWTVKDLPVGEGEAAATRVEEILHFDDVVYRQYSCAQGSVAVYVAYWQPGKVPVQIPASHTPDRCWTYVGWHCEDRRFHEVLTVDGKALLPAQWRKFSTTSGAGINVVFWHLYGGRLYDYGDTSHEKVSPLRWWRDQLQSLTQGVGEQYFIRVSSDQPLERILRADGFEQVMKSIAALGLYEPKQ